MANTYEPSIAIPPSETIQECLEERKLTPKDFAKLLDCTLKEVKELLYNKIAITEEIAKKLEKTFGVSTTFWLNLEKNYQETLKRLYCYCGKKSQNCHHKK